MSIFTGYPTVEEKEAFERFLESIDLYKDEKDLGTIAGLIRHLFFAVHRLQSTANVPPSDEQLSRALFDAYCESKEQSVKYPWDAVAKRARELLQPKP